VKASIRIILYTGKGGVGKTTIAAASALRCADLGYRTIIVSTDAAHSLGDVFDCSISPIPMLLAPNLWAQEIDVVYQIGNYWETIRSWFADVLALRGVNQIVAEEASVIPGMDELSNLFQIAHLYETGDYDVIIVDCAPTAETLSLLSLPEAARWYLKRVFPIERQAARIARPILRALTDIRIPPDDVFDAVEKLVLELNRVQSLLADRQITTVRLVLNPEKIVVREAQRTFSCLSLYGFAVDAVFSNRIIPPDVNDDYFDAWKALQVRHGRLIEEAFSPLPIFKIPLLEQEIVGFEMLGKLASVLCSQNAALPPSIVKSASDTKFGDVERTSFQDPAAILFEGETQTIEKTDGTYRLVLPIPFVTEDQLQISKHGDELVITLGNWRRNLLVPRVLSGLQMKEATMQGSHLVVTFGQASKPGLDATVTWSPS
jgi:arsenite-transporting ATPase